MRRSIRRALRRRLPAFACYSPFVKRLLYPGHGSRDPSHPLTITGGVVATVISVHRLRQWVDHGGARLNLAGATARILTHPSASRRPSRLDGLVPHGYRSGPLDPAVPRFGLVLFSMVRYRNARFRRRLWTKVPHGAGGAQLQPCPLCPGTWGP